MVARVDAADGADAPVALASAAYAALDRDAGDVDYAPLLDESAHAGGDPLRAAKAASDRHEEIIRRLDAERAQRDEAEARAARLPDALLFETPGSRVDVFARARRAAIDARLRRFDLAGTDAGASYRDLVRDVASMRSAGRLGVAVRAIWAYPGQRKLILWAIAAFVLGFLVHLLHGQGALSAIQVPSAAGQFVTDSTTKATGWIASHAAWFETTAEVLYVIGALALALNLWRAIGFASLLLRGAQLLNLDVRDRRRDLDNRIARLSQRVAALSADADAAARHAEAAARRAGGKAQTRAPGPDFLDARHSHAAAARGFLAALGERMGEGPASGAPERLVFVIDNLDALPPAAAVAWIEAAQCAIGAGAIGVVAFDPARLVDALGGAGEARRRFDKWLQVVVNLPGRAGVDGERLIARLLADRWSDGAAVARSGDREGAIRAADDRGDGAAHRARAARRRFAARGQALPQRLPPGPLLRCAPPRRRADAGGGLRRRRDAGGDAPPVEQRRRRPRAVRRPGSAGAGGQERPLGQRRLAHGRRGARGGRGRAPLRPRGVKSGERSPPVARRIRSGGQARRGVCHFQLGF